MQVRTFARRFVSALVGSNFWLLRQAILFLLICNGTIAFSQALNASPSENMGWFGSFTFEIDVFAIVISVILFFIVIKILAINYQICRNELSARIERYIHDFKHYQNFDANNFKYMQNEIEHLKHEIKNLHFLISTKKVSYENIQSLNNISVSQNLIEVFYLSVPNSDGSFNGSSATHSYKEGASIYKFTKSENGKAKFQIDENEASIKLALSYPDKIISPVCEAVNTFSPKAKKILTIYLGEAELKNDKWTINQKAKIRYES